MKNRLRLKLELIHNTQLESADEVRKDMADLRHYYRVKKGSKHPLTGAPFDLNWIQARIDQLEEQLIDFIILGEE